MAAGERAAQILNLGVGGLDMLMDESRPSSVWFLEANSAIALNDARTVEQMSRELTNLILEHRDRLAS
jgi:hypothetical protein